MDTIWGKVEGINIKVRIWPILKSGYGFRVGVPDTRKGEMFPTLGKGSPVGHGVACCVASLFLGGRKDVEPREQKGFHQDYTSVWLSG